MSHTSNLKQSCTEWLLTNLEYFRIDWQGDRNDILRRLKPFGDLALTAALLPAHSEETTKKTIATFLESNRPNVDVLGTVVAQYPQLFTLVGLTWDVMDRAGVGDPSMGRLVLDGLQTPAIANFERHAGQELALHWLEERFGLQHRFALEDIFERCIVASAPTPTDSDTFKYYVCHDLFFLSDWGQRRLAGALGRYTAWVPLMVEWKERCVKEDNLDLAAEIVLALDLAGVATGSCDLGPSAAATDIPSPPPSQGWGFIRATDSDAEKLFFRNHHTVLVCLMAEGRRLATKQN